MRCSVESRGIQPEVLRFKSVSQQNREIISKIKQFVFGQQVKPHEIAILSYTNQPLKYFEEALEKHNTQLPEKKIFYYPLITDKDFSINRKLRIPKGRLTVSTIHKAKGLEWRIVFCIGCNDEFFPGQNKMSLEEVDESRRLFYVATTRAIEHLFYSFICNQKYCRVTRFLSEIIVKPEDQSRLFYMDPQELQTKCFRVLYKPSANLDFPIKVTQVIYELTDSQFFDMRDRQLVADFNMVTYHLHKSYKLPELVSAESYHAEYGSLIDRYLQRIMGEKCAHATGPWNQDTLAEIVLFSYYLKPEAYEFYRMFEG